MDEITEQGQQLYLDFLRRQMQEQNIDTRNLNFIQQSTRNFEGNQDLGQLLDHFAKSPERVQVKEKADQVDYSGLSYEGFSSLLSGLFEDGSITYERVLVLFCFCSDLCIRAIKETAFQYFQILTNFSLKFISSTICVWVQAKGGWSVVLQQLQDKAGPYGLIFVGVFLIFSILAAYWHKQ